MCFRVTIQAGREIGVTDRLWVSFYHHLATTYLVKPKKPQDKCPEALI